MDLRHIAMECLAFWPDWLFAVAACFAARVPMSIARNGAMAAGRCMPTTPVNFLTCRLAIPSAVAAGGARCGPPGPISIHDKLTHVRRFKRKLTV